MTSGRLWAALAVAGLLMAGCQSAPSGGGEPSAGGGSAAPAVAPRPAGGGDLASLGAAMAKASSWHMITKGPGMESETDIVCPDKMKTVSKTGGMTVESMMIGKDMYTKAGKNWMKMANPSPTAFCGAGSAQAKATTGANVKTTKGATITVNGESCTEWTMGEGATATTMCIGSDSLPRQTKTGETTITYSNWNKPAAIEAPR